MIDVNQAAAAAERFVRGVYPAEALEKLRLEEIERSQDGTVWYITLGWVDATAAPSTGILAGLTPPRTYKTFVVDGTSGEVTSMKIRATV